MVPILKSTTSEADESGFVRVVIAPMLEKEFPLKLMLTEVEDPTTCWAVITQPFCR